MLHWNVGGENLVTIVCGQYVGLFPRHVSWAFFSLCYFVAMVAATAAVVTVAADTSLD